MAVHGVEDERTLDNRQSRKNYYKLLKDVYGPMWDLHVHTKVVIMSLIGKEKGRMGGRKRITAFRYGLPQSAGYSLFEGAILPVPKTGQYANPELLSKNVYTRLRWTGQVERAARMGKKAAWAGPRQIDMADAEKQFELNMARDCYIGGSQVTAVVKSYSASVCVCYGRNDRDSDVGDFFINGVHYLRVGQSIGFVDQTLGLLGNPAFAMEAGTIANNLYISAIDASDPNNPTFTTSTAPSASPHSFTPNTGDKVIPFGSRKDSITADATIDGDFACMNGISQVNTGTTLHTYLYGLLRSTYPTLQGKHLTKAGVQRPYTEMLATLMMDRIHDEGNGDDLDCFVLHRSMRREVVAEHEGDRRFAPVQQGSRGFAPKLSHTAGDTMVPFITDWSCLPGMVVGLTKANWGYMKEHGLEPLPERFVVDEDSWEMIWVKSGNLECTAPFNQGILDDLRFDVYNLTV